MEKPQTHAKLERRYDETPGTLHPDSVITSSWPIVFHTLSLPCSYFEASPGHVIPQILQDVSKLKGLSSSNIIKHHNHT